MIYLSSKFRNEQMFLNCQVASKKGSKNNLALRDHERNFENISSQSLQIGRTNICHSVH